jgi:hypothetical protein
MKFGKDRQKSVITRNVDSAGYEWVGNYEVNAANMQMIVQENFDLKRQIALCEQGRQNFSLDKLQRDRIIDDLTSKLKEKYRLIVELERQIQDRDDFINRSITTKEMAKITSAQHTKDLPILAALVRKLGNKIRVPYDAVRNETTHGSSIMITPGISHWIIEIIDSN